MQTTDYREAGRRLAAALTNNRPGYIARLRVTKGHREAAVKLAECRRLMAKVAGQRGFRNYETAAATPDTDYERSRFYSERRGLLAELLVDDMLSLAGIEHSMQALVSHTTEPGADLSFGGFRYDVKAGGQLSFQWSPAPHTGRFSDDQGVAINYGDHLKYALEPGAAGYICMYFYMQDDVPVAADVFFHTMAQVAELPLRGAAGSCPTYGKDRRHYLMTLDFVDDLHIEGYRERRAALEPHPFPPLAKAA